MRPIDAASLVAGLKRGDQQVAQIFVDRYYESILRYLFRMLGRRQCAEDVCQETFVRAMRRIDQVHDPEAFQAWLFQIATNLARDYVRQRPRETPFANAAFESTHERASGSPPGQRLYIADLLARLSEEHRVVIILRFYEDLSLSAISQVLGIPLGTVKSRLHYALRRLREYVQEEAEEVRQDALQRRRKTNPSHVG